LIFLAPAWISFDENSTPIVWLGLFISAAEVRLGAPNIAR
jgi:hypothetical protein